MRGGMAAEPKREEEGGMAKVVGAGLIYRRPRILGDAWWECAARRKASERARGRVASLAEMVSFRPGLARVVRVFKAPPPPRWTAEPKLRCDVFLETGPIAEYDGGNIFRSKVGESRRPAWQRPDARAGPLVHGIAKVTAKLLPGYMRTIY